MRDFGHFNITHREAEKQARYAARLHIEAGLGDAPQRTHFSRWLPWGECDAAAFAVASVGVC